MLSITGNQYSEDDHLDQLQKAVLASEICLGSMTLANFDIFPVDPKVVHLRLEFV